MTMLIKTTVKCDGRDYKDCPHKATVDVEVEIRPSIELERIPTDIDIVGAELPKGWKAKPFSSGQRHTCPWCSQ